MFCKKKDGTIPENMGQKKYYPSKFRCFRHFVFLGGKKSKKLTPLFTMTYKPNFTTSLSLFTVLNTIHSRRYFVTPWGYFYFCRDTLRRVSAAQHSIGTEKNPFSCPWQFIRICVLMFFRPLTSVFQIRVNPDKSVYSAKRNPCAIFSPPSSTSAD